MWKLKTITTGLICQGCEAWAKKNSQMPFNILMWRVKTHAEIWANYHELKKTFEKYLGKLSPKISESSLSKASTTQINTFYSEI